MNAPRLDGMNDPVDIRHPGPGRGRVFNRSRTVDMGSYELRLGIDER